MIDVTESEFEQVGDRRVRVQESTFRRSDGPNAVLVEGVQKLGYRTVTPAGVQDPTTVDHLNELISGTRDRVAEMADVNPEQYELKFRTYGVDAVPLYEANADSNLSEVGVIIDVLGNTQEIADTVCSLARSTLLHRPFEGRMATGGNLAFPYSPSDISVGEVYGFSVYHLVENVDQLGIAEIKTEEIV